MENLIRDIRNGGRSLQKGKGFCCTVVLTLSICIAVNVVIFAIVNSVLLRPSLFLTRDAILLMSNRYPKAVSGISIQAVLAIFRPSSKMTVFQEQAMFRFVDPSVNIGGTPERALSMAATPSLFRLLQIRPVLGRTLRKKK